MSETIYFRVCTIVNREEQYEHMRASFTAAGFDAVSTFTLFDNRAANRHDPYRCLEQVLADTTAPYIIFCHQDVLVHADQTPEHLLAVLRELDGADPAWTVAGNAGFDSSGEPILHLDSARGKPRCASLPRRTFSLDENFLILKAGTGLKPSAELGGFHLYGTDLCLNAYRARGAAYVVDFVVTHLSPGNPLSDDYKRSLAAFEACWRKQLIAGLIRTTCTQSLLSSNALFESWLPRYATIAQFMWDARITLVFRPARFGRLGAILFMLAVVPASGLWRFWLRPHFVRLYKPAGLVRWNPTVAGDVP